MATTSAYLNMTLPDASDLADISIIAGDFSAIDSKIEEIDTNIETLNTDKIAIANIVDGLTSTEANKPLSAKQGKELNDTKLAKSNVANTLDVVEEGKALDARQGKALKTLIDNSASPYVHTKTGTVHNFAGTGKLGFAKLTADYADGDTVTVSGGAVTVVGDLSDGVTDAAVLFSLADAAMFVYAVSSPFVVPDGDTATPVNDLETWLNCAGLQYSVDTLPTLTEVTGSATLCETLMNSANAINYLLRSPAIQTAVLGSTTAITALDNSNPYINPYMDSNSQDGCVASSSAGSAYIMFDADVSSNIYIGGGTLNVYLTLPNPIWLYKYKLKMHTRSNTGTGSMYAYASTDNVNWVTLFSQTAEPVTTHEYNIDSTFTLDASKKGMYKYFKATIIGGISINAYDFRVYGKTREV